MIDIMGKANEINREKNKIRSTVFKLEEYVIDQDPRKSKMIGYDMFNTDENGVPKKVEVFHFHKDNKTQGINEFATRSAMMHTRPGGLIRLSKFKTNPDGSYTTDHMQRIAEEDGPKIAANQQKYDIHYMKGWVKLYPDRDDNKELVLNNRKGRLFHKADVMVIPEDSKGTELVFGGPDFYEQLDKVLEQTINQTPHGGQPMVVVRQQGKLAAEEIRLPNYKLNAEKQAVPLTKEEIMVAAKERTKIGSKYIPTHEVLVENGETGEAEFVPGFAIQAIGLKWDGKSFQKDPQTGEDVPKYSDKSVIENWISETAQRHELPKQEGEARARYALDTGGPQYTFCILSTRTRQVPEGQYVTSDLDTLGRDLSAKIRTSPNAGLDVKPNPYMPAKGQPTQEAANTRESAAPAAAAATHAQPAPPAASQPAAPAASQPAPVHQVEEEPEIPDENMDFGMDDFTDDMDFDEALADLNL